MALLKAILGSKANFVPNVRGMIGGLKKVFKKSYYWEVHELSILPLAMNMVMKNE